MTPQTFAVTRPAMLRSLTSISSTPAPRIGRPTLAGRRIFLMPPPRTAERAAERIVPQFRIIASPDYPLDEARAVPGSRLVLHAGMGHDARGRLWPAVTADIARLTGLGP